MRRPVLFSLVLAVGCSAFGSSESNAPGADHAPVFVGSRLETFDSASITLLSPAGVQPNDLLVAAWWSGTVGYHVLSGTENDSTTYAFEGKSGQIATVAYRNAVRQQPISPVSVSSIPSAAGDGGVAVLDVPPFDTRGTSIPLYVFATFGGTTYPTITGLERLEASGAVAVYVALTASPAASKVAGPELDLAVVGGAPPVMVASLAVVGQP